MVQHLSLLQADGEADVLCCIRGDVGEKGAVVSKQQLSDKFLDGFRACEETPKVEETAICSETDVDASGWSPFASRSMMRNKMENNMGPERIPV